MALTPNVIPDAPILSAWGNEIRDRSNQVFGSTGERASAWPTPPAGAMSYIGGLLSVYNGSAWVCITPITAVTNQQEGTTSTAFVSLTTPGPAVTIQTGTKALVTLCSGMTNTGASGEQQSRMGLVVSGASAISAATNEVNGVLTYGTMTSNLNGAMHSITTVVSGLTAGTNTFTAVYRANLGAATFNNRTLTVVGIP